MTFDVRLNSPFVSQAKNKSIWKENIIAIYPKSLKAFFSSRQPFNLSIEDSFSLQHSHLHFCKG